MKALVIDDDDGVIQLVSLCLNLIWPNVEIAWTHLGNEGVRMVKDISPELIVLDIGLPDISGYDALKAIRTFSKAPLIVLTVRSEEDDVVKAFELGADDYIVKPFRKFEFLARAQSALAKFVPSHDNSSDLKTSFGNFQFDSSLKRLNYHGKIIELTSTESLTLRILLENVGQVVSYSKIEQYLWGHCVHNSVRIIRVYISRLRDKIEVDPKDPRLIITEPNQGYMVKNTF